MTVEIISVYFLSILDESINYASFSAIYYEVEYGNDKGLFADDPSEIVVLWSISDTGRSIYSVFL